MTKVFEMLSSGTVNPWGQDWDKYGEHFFDSTIVGHLWYEMPGAKFVSSSAEPNQKAYELIDHIADHRFGPETRVTVVALAAEDDGGGRRADAALPGAACGGAAGGGRGAACGARGAGPPRCRGAVRGGAPPRPDARGAAAAGASAAAGARRRRWRRRRAGPPARPGSTATRSSA